MLTKEICEVILNHKEGNNSEFNFKFATFKSSSNKFSVIFDTHCISKLYKIKDCIDDELDLNDENIKFELKVNEHTYIQIKNIKNLIIFLNIIRNNNSTESKYDIEWLTKNC